jgi:hypothetical protein
MYIPSRIAEATPSSSLIPTVASCRKESALVAELMWKGNEERMKPEAEI